MIICPTCQTANRPNARFCANCRSPLILQNKYRVLRLLGRGGFGQVYLAEHTALSAHYAIKELLPDPQNTPIQQQQAQDQFRFEASILARLRHPALPQVSDFFLETMRYYLVMEFVEGETLEERLTCQRGPLPLKQVIGWMDVLCDVLDYLHAQHPPVIHRDIKPGNIKVTPAGQLKLIDFGIAKVIQAGGRTAAAARAISPPYSPLEQYGAGTDARSDLYALGVALYQLLTDHLPPEAPDRVSQQLIPASQWNPVLPSAMDAVITKAIAPNAPDRYPSACEFNQALHQALGAKPAPLPVRPVTAGAVVAGCLDPDREYTFVCPKCGAFDESFQVPDFGELACADCGEKFQEQEIAQTAYGALAGERSFGCPACGNFDESFQVPDLGLLRCTNCDKTFSLSELQAIANGSNARTIDFGCMSCGEWDEGFQIPDYGVAVCSSCEEKFTWERIWALANGPLAGDRRFVCPHCGERDDEWHVPEYGAAKCASCDAIFPPTELARLKRRKSTP